MKDKNDKEISKGDIVEIHQTVNGQSKFVVLEVDPLDIRYGHDINRFYEYSKRDLLAGGLFGEVECEVVGNLYDFIKLLK